MEAAQGESDNLDTVETNNSDTEKLELVSKKSGENEECIQEEPASNKNDNWDEQTESIIIPLNNLNADDKETIKSTIETTIETSPPATITKIATSNGHDSGDNSDRDSEINHSGEEKNECDDDEDHLKLDEARVVSRNGVIWG